MGSKFHSELHTREGVNYLKLGGVIDEDNDLAALESKLGPGSLVINLSEVDRINSCGVRDWVNWLGRVEKNGARSILVECSPPIVSQINLVHNFTGAGVVKNFYAPYFCPRCEKEKLLLLETRDLVQNGPPFTAPMCRCDECDGPMEFDDMEESYFAFLSNAKKVPADPSVDAVMLEFAPEPTGSGVGNKLRPGRTGTSSAVGGTGGTPPSDPQAAAPGKEVAALPSVPVVASLAPLPVRPISGMGSSPGLMPLEAISKNGTTTTPGTPVALAQQMAASAQAERDRRALEDGRSPLAWGMLVVLLLLAAGLLAWVFMT